MRECPYRNPSAHRFRHAAQFGVGATFEMIVTLQFQRDIVRPALGAFNKAIVEGGHWSWRIYTKACRTAGCARRYSRFRIRLWLVRRTTFRLSSRKLILRI